MRAPDTFERDRHAVGVQVPVGDVTRLGKAPGRDLDRLAQAGGCEL
jgi:hypothetical protein